MIKQTPPSPSSASRKSGSTSWITKECNWKWSAYCFNPKLGVVEVGDARQVMGIMVDTEYDTESFRARLINVRQVGRNQRTLKNLRAAFNREIDPEKWEQMLTTKTIPFDLPEPGVKIAVKVIDQTGMEHMMVIDDPRALIQG